MLRILVRARDNRALIIEDEYDNRCLRQAINVLIFYHVDSFLTYLM